MKKKLLITLIIIISFFASITIYTPLGVKADSGFDSSYDSGGSWSSSSSSSDWGSSSSSWSSDHYSSSGGSSELTGGDVIMMLLFFGFMFTIIILSARKNNGSFTGNIALDHSKEISDDEVRKYIKDFDKIPFLRERFEEYRKVQEDWMNFDYDDLRTHLTDELYNQYEMQLDTLKVKNQKNIMRDFKYRDSMITGINKENNQITVTMELLVSFIDYIEENGKAVRGNQRIPITQHYSLTFVISENKLEKCPNCGAEIKDDASQKCEYCGSTIAKVGTKGVLSKKESIRQK